MDEEIQPAVNQHFPVTNEEVQPATNQQFSVINEPAAVNSLVEVEEIVSHRGEAVSAEPAVFGEKDKLQKFVADEGNYQIELLPQHWLKYDHGQYCKISAFDTCLMVAVSLVFNSKWVVYVHEKMVPETCKVFKNLQISNKNRVLDFMNAIDRAYMCIGNPEEMFIAACQEKNRVLRGTEEIVAEIVCTPFVDSRGTMYNCTVRKADCNILCTATTLGGSHRCRPCQTLRSIILQQTRNSSRS